MNLLNSRQDGAANTLELLERLVEAHDLVVARLGEGGQVGVVAELLRSSLPVRVASPIHFQAVRFVGKLHARIMQKSIVDSPGLYQRNCLTPNHRGTGSQPQKSLLRKTAEPTFA